MDVRGLLMRAALVGAVIAIGLFTVLGAEILGARPGRCPSCGKACAGDPS